MVTCGRWLQKDEVQNNLTGKINFGIIERQLLLRGVTLDR